MVRRPAVFAVVAVVAVVVAVVVAATAAAGLWFVPFVAGVAAGMASLRRPGVVPAATLGAVAGWALPLWILALRGLPAGATARAIAALAGIPPYAAVAIVVTLLLAALQTLVGAWLARALVPRSGRRARAKLLVPITSANRPSMRCYARLAGERDWQAQAAIAATVSASRPPRTAFSSDSFSNFRAISH
jgi:hypothetical protein